MGFTIHEIGARDLDLSVAECAAEVWKFRNPPVSPEAVLGELREFWSREKEPLLLLARDAGGAILGFRFGRGLAGAGADRILEDQNGGTVPGARRRGIGRALLREQHRIARGRGYTRVRTATALQLKPMIILNLQEGFDIVGLEDFSGKGWTARGLVFEKRL